MDDNMSEADFMEDGADYYDIYGENEEDEEEQQHGQNHQHRVIFT